MVIQIAFNHTVYNSEFYVYDWNVVILSIRANHSLTHEQSLLFTKSQTQCGQSQSDKSSLNYYHSIKAFTQEAQNLHKLKSPLSDPNSLGKSTSKCKHCETRFTS